MWNVDKMLSYRRGTARCVASVEILPIATQQCSPEQIEVMMLLGYSGPMCNKHVLAVLVEHRLVTETDTEPWLVPRMHSIAR